MIKRRRKRRRNAKTNTKYKPDQMWVESGKLVRALEVVNKLSRGQSGEA